MILAYFDKDIPKVAEVMINYFRRYYFKKNEILE